jgi:glycine/D-amino acid oxidase-like deaminating enzyme
MDVWLLTTDFSGQTCLVSNPSDRTTTRQHADGSWSFIIPRGLNGGTIIGGTKEPYDWNPEPSLAVRERLLAAAVKMEPGILGPEGKFNVIRDIVGRRPAREGGTRLEVETLPDQRKIVHAYGAGGRGFELSWGIAEEVRRMVSMNLSEGSKL